MSGHDVGLRGLLRREALAVVRRTPLADAVATEARQRLGYSATPRCGCVRPGLFNPGRGEVSTRSPSIMSIYLCILLYLYE